MQKGSWRLWALVLPLAAVVAAGCGREEESGSGGSGQTSAQLEQCEQAPDQILIGATLPLSGPGAPYGELFQKSMEIGRDMANEDGGPKIELKIMDSKAQAGPAVQQMNQLIDADDAPVVVSAYNDPPLAQAKIAEQTKTLLLNGGGNAPGLAGNPYVWNNVATIDQESRHIYEYAKAEMGVEQIAILAATDYTQEDIAAVRGEAEEVFGADNVQVVTFEPTATNVKPQLQQIRADAPDAIHLLNSGQLTITSAKDAAELGMDIPFLGTSGTLYEPDILQYDSMEGAHAAAMAFEASPEFSEVAEEKTGTPANAFTGNYADLVLVVDEAAQQLIDDGYCVTGEALNQVIGERAEAGESFEGANGPVSFSPDGTTARDLVVLAVEDGEITQVSEPTPAGETPQPSSGEETAEQ